MKFLLLIILILFFYSCTSVDSLIKDKEIDKAIDYCEKEKDTLDDNTDSIEDNIKTPKKLCYEKIADSYFKKGDFINAEKYYDIDFSDSIDKRKKSSFEIAEGFFAKKKYINALKYYDKTNKRNDGYLKVADAYLEAKELSNSLNLYTILDNKDGIKKIADTYYKNGEYLRAINLYKKLGLEKIYTFNIVKKLLDVHDFVNSIELYESLGSMQKARKAYKDFAYSLLEKNDFSKILNSDSPIVSILKSDDYLFVINLKGDIYQSYFYNNKFTKVFSLNSTKEKVISAKYSNKSNQIVLLTNAGLVFYNTVNKKINRRLNQKITAFAIRENEDFLITANENIISVRDFSTFDELLFFKGHTARVNEIIVSNNNVISAGNDKLIRVWNIETGEENFVLRGHFLAINSINIDSTKRFLVSGSDDKTAKVWDLSLKKLLNSFKFKKKVEKVIFSKDSSKLVVNLGDRVYKLVDVIDKKISDGLLFHSDGITDILIDKSDYFIYSTSKLGNLFISTINKDILIERLLSKSGLNEDDYFKVAELYFNKHKYSVAKKYYQLSNKKEVGFVKIGDAYSKAEDFTEALNYYKLLTDDIYMEKIADTYFKLGDYDNSSRYFIKAKNYTGVLKSAKMFLYEENYYDAVRLYVELSKLYDKTTETDKINSIYLKIADIFMNMKQSSYKGSEDVDFIKKVDEQLKSWYDSRFSIAQGYYDKANMSNEGYTKIGKFLCDNHNFVLCIESYEKLEDVKESKGLIIEAQRNGAVYYFEKAGESYKSLSQLAKDEGDWNLITENFNNSVEFLEKSKNFYKKLRDYKKLRKIQKIERQLKRYKKTLGLK